MAETPYEGKKYVFLIDPANGTNYGLIVCLTDNSFNLTANVIDASSKCGTYKFNGVKDRTIEITGNMIMTPDSGHYSEADLHTLFENDTPFGWLFGPETPEAGDTYYTGVDAIISNLGISAPNEGAVTFTATVQLNGVPVQNEQS